MQKLTIIGHLGGDPEARFTPSGKAVTNMSVASTEKWKNAEGEPMEETTWFRVTAWGAQAENAGKFLHKGSQVAVFGKLKPDEKGRPKVFVAEGKDPIASFDVTAEQILFLDSAKKDESRGAPSFGAAPGSEDDVPF